MKRKKKAVMKGRTKLILVAALAAVGLFTTCMLVNASVLHVMRAEVALQDLPPALDGTKILYISDVDLCGLNTPERAADAVNRLQRLEPDMLILGGDYTSPTLWEVLNRSTDLEAMARRRQRFFHLIRDFAAPLGKFALASADDLTLGDVRVELYENGFTALSDARQVVYKNGEALWLVGVGADGAHVSEAAMAFRRNDCVVCVAESPECYPRVMTAEAADTGRWTDLCLSGKTHGGQIRILGRNALALTANEQQFLSGWTRETGVPMLTSSGMGCEGVNLRLDTQAEVWLIELKCFT